MTKKQHRCDEGCTHPPKRKMGTTKKKLPSTSGTISEKVEKKPEVQVIKLPNSLADELEEGMTTSIVDNDSVESWVNTVAATMGIPSKIEKDPTIKEIEELLLKIRTNGTTQQVELANKFIETARTGLRNINIG